MGLFADFVGGGLWASGIFDPYVHPAGTLDIAGGAVPTNQAFMHIGWDRKYLGVNPQGFAAGARTGVFVESEKMGRAMAMSTLKSGLVSGVVAPVGLNLLFGGSISELPQMYATDLAVHAALYRHHLNPAAASGRIAANSGLVAPGLISGGGRHAASTVSKNVFANPGWWGRAANTAGYIGKGAVGGIGSFLGAEIGAGLGRGAADVVGISGWGRGAMGLTGRAIGTTAGAYAGVYGASMFMAAASNPATLAALAVGTTALVGTGMVAGGAYLAARSTYRTLRAGYYTRQMQKSINTSGSLAAFHTQNAVTMRARAVQAIHKSHLNARSALGQEANYMHYPSRSYHGKYRRFY